MRTCERHIIDMPMDEIKRVSFSTGHLPGETNNTTMLSSSTLKLEEYPARTKVIPRFHTLP